MTKSSNIPALAFCSVRAANTATSVASSAERIATNEFHIYQELRSG